MTIVATSANSTSPGAGAAAAAQTSVESSCKLMLYFSESMVRQRQVQWMSVDGPVSDD
eukprot:m.184974 g.184974  ORF g.184974 m.184974 type:complete len:58 (+) comp15022_c0_seq2:3534-3707(+)